MSMIPDEVIEQVRDAADLVGIIGEAVQLKRMGADYRGPCPFHGGANRNFAVIPKKGMYYCFVCHQSGDIFTWLMRRFGMDYPTAVRDIARRVGIVIPEPTGRAGPDPREPFFQAVALAQEFYARQLQEAEEGRGAREYLAGRDISLEQAGEWGLGYAPRGAEFREEMTRLGVDEQILLEAGLLHKRDNGTLAPRFRGRLLFPIHDVRGRVVGFGGRLLGPGEPKYLNSPETPVFRKGQLLYHLHQAKGPIRREETALLVEGYFDVLRLHLAGIEHVVAPLGTALTEDQAATLRRYAKTVVLLYDSDRAGLRATFRSGDILLQHGLRVRVASLPPGEDPDSLARSGGAAAIQTLVRDGLDLLERKIQVLDQRGWLEDLQKKREALDRMLPTLRAASDPVVRDLYVGRVAERFGIGRDTLEREIRSRPAAPRRETAGPGGPGVPPSTGQAPARARKVSRTEERLLRVMLASPAWRERGAREATPEWFAHPATRAVYSALAGLTAGVEGVDAVEALPAEYVEYFDRLRERVDSEEELDLDAEYSGLVDHLRERVEFRRVRAAPDPEERKRIMAGWSPETRQRYAYFRAARQRRA